MAIISDKIESYMKTILPDRPQLLLELESQAESNLFPIIGPHVGTLLEILARSMQAKRVMELGSGFGYSALWFFKGLPPDGKVILTDFSEENCAAAGRNLDRMSIPRDRWVFRLGDALELLEKESGPLDIIFNDIGKERYPDVIEPAFSKLKKGGLLVSDNTLWHGYVVTDDASKATEGVKEYNRILQAHDGFLTVCLPVRDGVSISVKC